MASARVTAYLAIVDSIDGYMAAGDYDSARDENLRAMNALGAWPADARASSESFDWSENMQLRKDLAAELKSRAQSASTASSSSGSNIIRRKWKPVPMTA